MPPINLAKRQKTEHDFRLVGISWFVKEPGVPFSSVDPSNDPSLQKFYTLSQLREAISTGTVQPESQLSHDLLVWNKISDIYDLDYLFQEVWDKEMWQRSWSGETHLRYEIGENDDFDEDCPTRTGVEMKRSRTMIMPPEAPYHKAVTVDSSVRPPRGPLIRLSHKGLIMIYPLSVVILGMALYLIN